MLEFADDTLYSKSIPNINNLNGIGDKGFLLLYGEIKKKIDDGIEWDLYKQKTNSKKPSKRWDVKKIILDKPNYHLKLKNTASNGEDEIMRRQVWKGKDNWVKHEFKLLQKETVTSSDDGSFMRETVSAKPFPVLVHYFKDKKRKSAPSKEGNTGSVTKKQKTNKQKIKEIKEEKIIIKNPIIKLENQMNNLTLTQLVKVEGMTPDYGFSSDQTIVLINVPDLNFAYDYFCQINQFQSQVQIQGTIKNSQVMQIIFPPHDPGFVEFQIIGRRKQSIDVTAKSDPCYFTFIPSFQGYLNLSEKLDKKLLYDKMHLFGNTTKELDLSKNNIGDIGFLDGFNNLECLYLQNNNINSLTMFPYLPNLRYLVISKNNIEKMDLFLKNNFHNFPQLVFLETTDNPCSNFFFNDQFNKSKYDIYRLSIIKIFNNLEEIDSQPVTVKERTDALSFGNFFEIVPIKKEMDTQMFEFIDEEIDHHYLIDD